MYVHRRRSSPSLAERFAVVLAKEDGMDSQDRSGTDLFAPHAQAVPLAGAVLDAVRPDHLDEPTPCTEWSVRAVANHLTWLHRSFAAAGAGAPPPDPTADLIGDDPKAAFTDAAHASDAAMHAPGALDRA